MNTPTRQTPIGTATRHYCPYHRNRKLRSIRKDGKPVLLRVGQMVGRGGFCKVCCKWFWMTAPAYIKRVEAQELAVAA
jgi:hypothetical protein